MPSTISPNTLMIRPARDADAAAWDKFVFDRPTCTFFHRFGWRAIFRDVFGLIPHYLVAEIEGAVIGILPLVHQKSVLFGNSLIAAPFCVEGGSVAVNLEVRDRLDQEAISLLQKLKAGSLEFRSRVASRAGWSVRKELYATFERELSGDDEANLQSIP